MPYLDYNATTPCAPEVIEAMLPYFASEFGNASSAHAMGRRAARAVEQARLNVARAIGAQAEDIIFTSGATESNNLVIRGLHTREAQGRRVVLSTIEHRSVEAPCRWLSMQGFDLTEIPVTPDCTVDLVAAASLIDDKTAIVSVQGANNETGVLQPIRAIAEITHARSAPLHCDAAQLLGKVPISVDDLGVDFASLSSHKAYGPKGVGALYIRPGRERDHPEPLLLGGGQESGLRSGTINVPGIVGFGAACRVITEVLDDDMVRVGRLRDTLERGIHLRIPDSVIVGAGAQRLPGTVSVFFGGVPAEALIAAVPAICISSGAACASGSFSPSRILLACGYSREFARNVVRISLGRFTTEEEVEIAVAKLASAVSGIRDQTCAPP